MWGRGFIRQPSTAATTTAPRAIDFKGGPGDPNVGHRVQ
jgi:hypothetical protein